MPIVQICSASLFPVTPAIDAYTKMAIPVKNPDVQNLRIFISKVTHNPTVQQTAQRQGSLLLSGQRGC